MIFGDVFQQGSGCQACPGGNPIYTCDDLSAAVGKYVLLIDGVCYLVSELPCDDAIDCYEVEVRGIYDTQQECCDAAAAQ